MHAYTLFVLRCVAANLLGFVQVLPLRHLVALDRVLKARDAHEHAAIPKRLRLPVVPAER